ncbi:transposable element Tcb1 transposase [Trichonephila clavipes]|nr:transposable element Tcb1 transposase [Trichonephila clavipes]
MRLIVRHDDESVRGIQVKNWKYPRNLESRLWQRFQDDGNVSTRYSTGRPRVTTPNKDRYPTVTTKRNKRHQTCLVNSGMIVSRQTVYRRLGQVGQYAHKPVTCVPLTAIYCRLRLAWNREHAYCGHLNSGLV